MIIFLLRSTKSSSWHPSPYVWTNNTTIAYFVHTHGLNNNIQAQTKGYLAVSLKVVEKEKTVADLWGVIPCEKPFRMKSRPIGKPPPPKICQFYSKIFLFFVQYVESQFFSAFLLQFTKIFYIGVDQSLLFTGNIPRGIFCEHSSQKTREFRREIMHLHDFCASRSALL